MNAASVAANVVAIVAVVVVAVAAGPVNDADATVAV